MAPGSTKTRKSAIRVIAGKWKGRRLPIEGPLLPDKPIDDAPGGTTGEKVSQRGVPGPFTLQGEPVQWADRRFGTQQVTGTHLDCRRSEPHGGGDPCAIGNTAGGNHRHLYRRQHLGQQCQGAHLGRHILFQKHPPMATRLQPLGDDYVGTPGLKP